MGHLEGNLRPSYIWDARFLKVNSVRRLSDVYIHVSECAIYKIFWKDGKNSKFALVTGTESLASLSAIGNLKIKK